MSLQFSICLTSFASFVFSSSQVGFLASSSDCAFSTSLFSSLIVLSLVYFSSTFILVWACSRAKTFCCRPSLSAMFWAFET